MRISFGPHKGKRPAEMSKVELRGLLDWIDHVLDGDPRAANKMRFERERTGLARELDQRDERVERTLQQATVDEAALRLGYERLDRVARRDAGQRLEKLLALDYTVDDALDVVNWARRQYEVGTHWVFYLDLGYLWRQDKFGAHLLAAQGDLQRRHDAALDLEAQPPA